MSRLERQLEDALFANLEKHARSFDPDHAGDPYTIHQCNAAEKEIGNRFRDLGLSDASIAAAKESVSARLFAERRRCVDACVTGLQTDVEFDQICACDELMTNLFSPFYRRSSYDSADYFASRGGVRLLVDLISKSLKANNENLTALALMACQEFSSDESRTAAIAEEGIMDLLVTILKSSTQSQMLKSKATGVMCALLDVREAQLKAVEAGALEPIIDVCLSSANDLTDVEAGVSCLHCCASNPAIVERLLQADVVEKLSELSVSVVGRHRHELDEPLCPEIIHFLPKMIVFVCHATNSLLLNLSYRATWAKIISKKENVVERIRDADCCQLPMWSKAMDVASQWLDAETPESVWEAEHDRYVWPTLRSFTSLLRCYHPIARQMGAFAVAKLCLGAENRDTLRKEEGPGLDVIQLSTWSWGGKAESRKRELAKGAMIQLYSDNVDPPQLKEICLQYVSAHRSLLSSATDQQAIPQALLRRIVAFC